MSFDGKPGLVIVGSGHRPGRLGVSDNPATWRPAIEHLADLLAHFSVLAHGRLEVLSGMAEGFDLMLAGAALKARDEYRLGIRLVAAIPFENDTMAFQHPVAKKWHAHIRERADHVHIASGQLWNFRDRNYWMADRPRTLGVPGICWAAYDGEPKGGTYQTVNRAKLNNLPVDTRLFRAVREQLGVS